MMVGRNSTALFSQGSTKKFSSRPASKSSSHDDSHHGGRASKYTIGHGKYGKNPHHKLTNKSVRDNYHHSNHNNHNEHTTVDRISSIDHQHHLQTIRSPFISRQIKTPNSTVSRNSSTSEFGGSAISEEEHTEDGDFFPSSIEMIATQTISDEIHEIPSNTESGDATGDISHHVGLSSTHGNVAHIPPRLIIH